MLLLRPPVHPYRSRSMSQQLRCNLSQFPLCPGIDAVDPAGLSRIQNEAIRPDRITYIQKITQRMARGEPKGSRSSRSGYGSCFTAYNMLCQQGTEAGGRTRPNQVRGLRHQHRLCKQCSPGQRYQLFQRLTEAVGVRRVCRTRSVLAGSRPPEYGWPAGHAAPQANIE